MFKFPGVYQFLYNPTNPQGLILVTLESPWVKLLAGIKVMISLLAFLFGLGRAGGFYCPVFVAKEIIRCTFLKGLRVDITLFGQAISNKGRVRLEIEGLPSNKFTEKWISQMAHGWVA